jgi:leucyl/phenylalanyl-tRNA--protein transferase
VPAETCRPRGSSKPIAAASSPLRNRGHEIRLDAAFATVMERCADPQLRPEGTWISPDMRAAYLRLHQLGYAHSVETWQGDRLVGGLYGMALGPVFFGESMFSLERDASKVALARLVELAVERGIGLIDCQVASPHLESLGARAIPRAEFALRLSRALPELPPPASWR